MRISDWSSYVCSSDLHEAECAQSECYHHAPLARYWVHNAMVLSDGQKMSKSLGNFITVADVLEKHPGEVLKFAMLQTHYRHPFDFRWSRLQEARSEEHTSELQSLMRISYAGVCLNKKKVLQ